MATSKIVSCKPLAELQLDFPEFQSWSSSQRSDGKLPVFLASQLVLGYVDVTYLNACHYLPGDRIQVSLEGISSVESWVATNPCNYDWTRKYDTKQILHMTKTLPIKTHIHSGPTFSPTYRLGYEFQACTKETPDIRFGPPESAGHEGSSLDYGLIRHTCFWSIPSSSTTRFALPGRLRPGDDGYLEVSFKYQLTAMLLRETGHENIAQVSKPIIILDDSHRVQPPTCIADYPDEYRLLTAAVVRSNSLARTLVTRISHHPKPTPPRLFVRTSEPSPLVFHRSLQHATTLVPIELAFLNPQSNDQNIANNDVKITWRLQQSRFSAFNGLKKIPTRKRVQKARSEVSYKMVQESMNTYTCRVGQWRNTNVGEDILRYGLTTATPSFEKQHVDSATKHSRNNECLQGRTDIEPSHKPELAVNDTSLDLDYDRLYQVPPNVQNTPLPSSIPPPTPPSSSSPSLSTSKSMSDPGYELEFSQSSAHTTTISLPVSIPLSSFKSPTSTTPYMVIRYALSIQVRVQFSSSNTKAEQGLGETRRERQETRDKWKDSNRKISSWAADARLNVPIQLIYTCNDEDQDRQHSSCSASRMDSTLDSVTNDDELDTIRGIMAGLDSRASGSSENATSSAYNVGGYHHVPVHQQWEEERESLPTYEESTGRGHAAVTLPAATACS